MDRLNPAPNSAALPAFAPRRIGTRSAERLARLAAPRAPIALGKGKHLTLGAPVLDEWAGCGKPLEVALTCRGEEVFIRTVAPLLQRIMAEGDVRLPQENVDAELAAMLLETALLSDIEQLELLLGGSIELRRIGGARDHTNLADLGFRVSVDGTKDAYPGMIYGPAPLMAAIARNWDLRPIEPLELNATRFTLSSRAALIDLTLGALSGLAIGDAMVFDRVALAGGAAIVLADRLSAPAMFDEDGMLTLSASFTNKDAHFGDFAMNDHTAAPEGPALTDAAIDDLPVRLVFEIGRVEMTLDELRKLAVGSPLPLERAATSAVDIIANGRRIGAGEIVLIGEELGVQITRLTDHA